MKDLWKRLKTLNIESLLDVEGKVLSSYRGGGSIALTIYPNDTQELATALREVSAANVPYSVLGAGTNCLIRDSGYPGAVLCTAKLRGISQSGTTVTAAAGESLPALAAFAAKNGLGGLEALSGIPSSVGGAVIMNAGAFGQDTAGILAEAEILHTKSLNIQKIDAKAVPFSYRSSGHAFANSIICSASFCFNQAYDEALHMRVREERLAKQPREPSLGSVFKNPPAFAAGFLIEGVGLKGFRLGNAVISKKHANFIVNLGGGTARDYLSLMELAQSMVYNEYKIKLEPEIQILG